MARRKRAEQRARPSDAELLAWYDRHRPLDPQYEYAGLGRLAFERSRPLDLLRFRMGRDLRAHDLGPTGHEFGRGKALLGKRVTERLVQKVRQRTRI